MAITVTVEDVRSIIPELSATDAAIALQISVVQCKVGACLESNYAHCPDVAKAIIIYTVAYFAEKGNDNRGAVTSRKWADGDSESYADRGGSASSQYWDTALQLDSSGCIANAFRSGKVFTVTGSAAKYYPEPR